MSSSFMAVMVVLLAFLPAFSKAQSFVPTEILFKKQMLSPGASETCAFVDVNGDQHLDIVSGEYWYEAPGWNAHKFRNLGYEAYYIDNFSDLPIDVDGDGKTDIVSCSYFGKRLAWWRNPGQAGSDWEVRIIEEGVAHEFAFLVDLDNDGQAKELLPQFGENAAALSWYGLTGGRWVKHAVSSRSFGHGIGAGDVNQDGRTDIVTPKGWFEAPEEPEAANWDWHPDFDLGVTGFIHVLDLNRDGLSDILTTLAHDYGIFWLEQTQVRNQWRRHLIDDSWSQAHAAILTDLNGDDQLDLLTGKRYLAHNGHDPGGKEPLGIYWYEYRVVTGAEVVWFRHVIDYSTRSGGGIQIAQSDLDEDGDVDFAVGGKGGLFLFENLGDAAR